LSDAIFKPYGLNIGWRFFHFSEVSLVFGFIIPLGVFGAWLATTQHLLGFRAKK
jgi:ABC transporter, ftsX cell division permease